MQTINLNQLVEPTTTKCHIAHLHIEQIREKNEVIIITSKESEQNKQHRTSIVQNMCFLFIFIFSILSQDFFQMIVIDYFVHYLDRSTHTKHLLKIIQN